MYTNAAILCDQKLRAEILELQTSTAEEVEIDGRTGTICVIVEEEPERGLRVIVQGFLDSKYFTWSVVKSVSLDGFRINLEGKLMELEDKEYYEFD